MVRISRILIRSICMILLSSSAGCGFVKGIWGEKAPPRKIVILESSGLPPATDIFSDDEEVASSTFHRYEKMALDTFDQIKGQRKNFLSMQEIERLGKAGLAKLSDQEELNLARIRSVLTLLGFKEGISRDQVITLLQWVDDNRHEGKAFYDAFIRENSEQKITSLQLIKLIRFTGSLIALGGETPLSNSEVQNLLKPWIPENYVHAIKALPSGIDLLVSALGSLCGDRVDQDQWNAKKNGTCLLFLVNHFQNTAPVFDLIFDRLNPITERSTLATANAHLADQVQSWIKGHRHPPFMTQKVQTFSEQLEIPTPYHFFQLTEWIPKLNAASTAKALNPVFFIDVAKVLQNWVDTFLEVTAGAKEGKYCKFAEWRKCEFTGDYDTADKLFNDEYATLIRHKDLDFIIKISLYDSIGDYLIKALDEDKDGLLKDDIKDLITLTVRLLDSNAFAQNVIARVQEKPISVVNTEQSIQTLRRQGLGEVAALAADLIPDRGGRKRTLLKKLTSQVYDAQKYPAYTLDRLGITTFIYVFDLLANLRQQYLQSYDFQGVVDGTHTWIKRRKVVELIPQMLHDQFPRIYNECLDWGFERTCGVLFTEVLPSATKDDLLEPSDIDMITLTSILLESMMNRCDRDHDDGLSTNILDGFDEKHCTLTVSRNLANRFMRANILDNDRSTKTWLNILKWVPPARWAAKVALEKGTLKGIGIRAVPGISLYSRKASLGGVMSLAAEFMDPDKTEAIESGTLGPHVDAGDELIYLHRMTDHYLPSHEWALRTSEAAKLLYGPAKVAPYVK